MTGIGRVTHTDGVHRAECGYEDCPWVAESRQEGKVSHHLMDHNTEEHAR